MLVSRNTLSKTTKLIHDDIPGREERKRDEEKTCVHPAMSLCLLFSLCPRVRLSIGSAEGRDPDRRDEAARGHTR